MGRFDGRTVVVIGAAGGIGEATARSFLAEGATVVLADANLEAAQGIAKELGAVDRAYAVDVDVTDPAQVDSMLAAVADRTGGLDVLVNSAGVIDTSSLADLDHKKWRLVYAVNVDGILYASQSFARIAAKLGRKGAIVNLASASGLTAMLNRSAYVSSKHAVVGLTREMSLELGPMGIRVNAVAPGVIRTPMTAFHFDDPSKSERIKLAHALGRGGYPDEVASAIRFLASDEAGYVTGIILSVDGGFIVGKNW